MLQKGTRSRSLLFFVGLWCHVASGQNIVVTSESQISILAARDNGNTIVTQRLPDGAPIRQSLPSGISSVADVSIDPTDESKVFALSTDDRQVCSFRLDQTTAGLSNINCVGGTFAVSPFAGISAYDGTLVISGGTGGLTVFEYDRTSGRIQSAPRFRNVRVPGVVGFPDVALVDARTASLSTDFSGVPRFGTMMVSLDGDDAPARVRDFRVADSLGFSLSEGPANFPLVNAFFRGPTSASIVMYTANGAVTAQNPSDPNSSQDITDILTASSGTERLQAVSVAVHTPTSLLVVGGREPSSGSFVVQVFSIADDRFAPVFVMGRAATGRLTSVAVTAGSIVAYSNTGVGVGVFQGAKREDQQELSDRIVELEGRADKMERRANNRRRRRRNRQGQLDLLEARQSLTAGELEQVVTLRGEIRSLRRLEQRLRRAVRNMRSRIGRLQAQVDNLFLQRV